MNVLAIESSCQTGSVAILKGGTVVISQEFDSPRGRGTELFAHLESALRACGDLDLVVVGTGPGRYNGLRAAISAAWGIARARGSRRSSDMRLRNISLPAMRAPASGFWRESHTENF